MSLPGASVVLDRDVRVLAGGRVLLGGDPPRLLRLSDAGVLTVRALAAGHAPAGEAQAALARRLLDAGLAHPRPARTGTGEVTVVIPVRDRPVQLVRCLAAIGEVEAIVVVDDGSADPAEVGRVCDGDDRITLVRREAAGGPAAARNAALAQVRTALIAFLDSDCVPEPGWLSALCGALASDPALAAVAPRLLPPAAGLTAGAVARFAAVRSPLDLGPRPARVRPGGRVAYVPAAALLVRAEALGDGFDEALRHGEDVDLVWRLADAGHRIHYEPSAVVRHLEPARWRALLARRYRYGTSAGPLARRHPGRLAPLVVHARPLAVLTRLRGAGVPCRVVAEMAARDLAETVLATGRAATMLVPGALAAALSRRRTRWLALTLLLAEPLRTWRRTRPALDPVRFVALAIADDVAYGAGVWTGAVRGRTARPLLPRVLLRARPSIPRRDAGATPGLSAGTRACRRAWDASR